MTADPREIVKALDAALTRHESATDAMAATAAGDDPHAAALASMELEKANALLATWTQPEYLRALIDCTSIPAPAEGDDLTDAHIERALIEGRKLGEKYMTAADIRGARAVIALATSKAQPKGTAVAPHPGSPEASAMIDSELAARNWPTNTTNAARAGYVACMKLTSAAAPSPAPVAESVGTDGATFYLVLAPNGLEGVAFTDKADARYAATGRRSGFGVSTIGEAFRDAYEEADSFEIIEVRATTQSPAVKPEPVAPKPDRTGMTYYRKDGCPAASADAPDCICWSPSEPPVQGSQS